MAKVCKITNKRPLVGNNVSKSHRKTKRRQLPNLQAKKLYIPELKRSIKLKLSTTAIKTIDKNGLFVFLKKNNLKLADII